MPRLLIIEDLTTVTLPEGSVVVVEFEPASQWYGASYTIAAGWLRSGGSVTYGVFSQSPDEARSYLKSLGLDMEALENGERLRIVDAYTATLGQKSIERYPITSLKVTDLSLEFAKAMRTTPSGAAKLHIRDNASTIARFNDERTWVEFLLTRLFPSHKMRKVTAIIGIVKGVHSEWVYKQLEAAADGVIDFKVDDVNGERRSFIGIRNMRKAVFDSRWYPLKIRENLEVALDR